MSITTVYDFTGANYGHVALPAGVVPAGYDTGSGGVAWDGAQWAAHPDAIHIDQDANASDFTADILDVEARAATPDECAGWYKSSVAKFNTVARVGQRHPSFYASAAVITPIVNALIAGGVTSGPGLWVADWNLSSAQAVLDVQNASGPFPIIGVQFRNVGPYDVSVFSSIWLEKRAEKTPVQPPAPTPTPAPASGVQPLWRACRKCSGLVFAAYGGDVCAAGGKHDTAGSYDYDLSFKNP